MNPLRLAMIEYMKNLTKSRAAAQKAWREKNKDKVKAYRETHREDKLVSNRLWYLKNREAKLANNRLWYLKNKENVKEYQRKNKKKIKRLQKRRYKKKKQKEQERAIAVGGQVELFYANLWYQEKRRKLEIAEHNNRWVNSKPKEHKKASNWHPWKAAERTSRKLNESLRLGINGVEWYIDR